VAPAASTAPAASAAPAAEPGKPLLAALGFEVTKTYTEKRFTWRQVQGLNWQASAEGLEALPPEPPLDPQGCPPGMVRVRGQYTLDAKGRDDTDGVQMLQDKACKHWRTADHSIQGLCDDFDASRWRETAAGLPKQPMDVCVDRYEFPNRYGEFPLVVVRYIEGKKYCEKVGKRLCTESEWTFACEGEEGLPYPYGYERDKTACTIDILAAGPDKDTFRPRTTGHTARGVDFAWRAKRSGESPRCKSPFGVMDTTGNVDEWTESARKYGYRMILKGGHWGPARQRCRPQTRGHGPMYVRYDQGFRCCADAP
jgi:hypothetical protein